MIESSNLSTSLKLKESELIGRLDWIANPCDLFYRLGINTARFPPNYLKINVDIYHFILYDVFLIRRCDMSESLRTMQMKSSIFRTYFGKVKGKRSKLRDKSGKIIEKDDKNK